MTDNDEEQREIIHYINNMDDNLEKFRKKFEQDKYLKITEETGEISNEELIN
jgi:hypothetical protein